MGGSVWRGSGKARRRWVGRGGSSSFFLPRGAAAWPWLPWWPWQGRRAGTCTPVWRDLAAVHLPAVVASGTDGRAAPRPPGRCWPCRRASSLPAGEWAAGRCPWQRHATPRHVAVPVGICVPGGGDGGGRRCCCGRAHRERARATRRRPLMCFSSLLTQFCVIFPFVAASGLLWGGSGRGATPPSTSSAHADHPRHSRGLRRRHGCAASLLPRPTAAPVPRPPPTRAAAAPPRCSRGGAPSRHCGGGGRFMRYPGGWSRPACCPLPPPLCALAPPPRPPPAPAHPPHRGRTRWWPRAPRRRSPP